MLNSVLVAVPTSDVGKPEELLAIMKILNLRSNHSDAAVKGSKKFNQDAMPFKKHRSDATAPKHWSPYLKFKQYNTTNEKQQQVQITNRIMLRLMQQALEKQIPFLKCVTLGIIDELQ